MTEDLIERAARRMLLERAKHNLAHQGVPDATNEAIGEPPESSMAVARADVQAVLSVVSFAEAKDYRRAKTQGMQ